MDAIWLAFLLAVTTFFAGYIVGMVRTSNSYNKLLNSATEEINKNSAANRELFAELKRKGIY